MLNWENLKSSCENCQKCPLHKSRRRMVFGTGNINSKVMLIGEAPGEKEDLRGEPFVGPAGKLLDDMLLSIGLARQQVYIANILKCRPPLNRDPSGTEQDACIGWLRNQVYLIRPKIIMCLGRIAAMRIIKPDIKITSEHGLCFKKNGCILTSTFHPSALLRDPSKRPEAFSDLLVLKRLLEEE